ARVPGSQYATGHDRNFARSGACRACGNDICRAGGLDGRGGQLQQVGTGAEIGRRASLSPAPRPVLRDAFCPGRLRSRPRRGAKRKVQVRVVAFTALGMFAPLVFAGVARPLNSPAPALAEIERLIELAGFGLTQVSVTGHRYSLDSDIFDAIGLEN